MMGGTRKVAATAVLAALLAGCDPGEGQSGVDKCEALITSRLPAGAFIVLHTEPDKLGETLWMIDHNGIREGVGCSVGSDGPKLFAVNKHPLR